MTKDRLARLLAPRVALPQSQLPLDHIAEYFEAEHGRHALIDYISEAVAEHAENYPAYFRTIVNLPLGIIVRTALDDSLEWLLRLERRKFVKVVRNEEVYFIDDDKLLLVKLYGDTDNKSSVIVTREDHVAFFDQLPSIADLLRYYFSTKTLLFLDFDLDDPHFLQLYAFANQRAKGYQRRAYAVKEAAPEPFKVLWGRRNLTILDVSTGDFLSELARRIGKIVRLPPKDLIASAERGTTTVPRGSPYKFLSHYEEHDADIFFGRDWDIVKASRVVLSSKLTVIYGRSGFGKTSLISAGIIPRLARSGYLPVYSRCGGDPLRSIKAGVIERLDRTLRDDTGSPAFMELQASMDLPLPEFIGKVGEICESPLVLFIDQFEEFFVSLSDRLRTQLEDELAECVESPHIGCVFVLSLREDFLPELHELRRLRHTVYANRYRLKALTADQAIQAISKPAEELGIGYEEGLVELLVEQLSEAGQVDPTQLQIVCDRLYNSMPEGTSRIDRVLYEALGGVKQIITDYLEAILDTFDAKRRGAAKRLLRSMVSSAFTRAPLSRADALLELADLEEWTDLDTDGLLTELVRTRLVRRAATEQEGAYELTHEYLINKIREWMDFELLKAREAQDLLRQEYGSWLRHRIPVDRTAINIIDGQRSKLALSNKLNAFILAGAVRYQFELVYWVGRNLENADAIDTLLWVLREDVPQAKRVAAVILGCLTREESVILEALGVCGSIANPSTVSLIEELQASGLSFAPMFLDKVRNAVERRFSRNMVLVPAGEFVMGASREEIERTVRENQLPWSFFEGQYPQRRVPTEAFWIDMFPVTNAEFQEFRLSHTFPSGHENHPAVHVSWYEAAEYASWLGKTLPSEEEWEKSARGYDGRRFPWGDEWDPARCNTRLSGYGGTTRVDQYPLGVSPVGCFDMAGNVWEWTSTWLDQERRQIVLKGGSWSKYGILPWCYYRFNYEPESGYSNVGFRCVKR